MEYSKIWWNHIPRPRLLADTIASTLLSGTNVHLILPEQMDWSRELEQEVQDRLARQSAVKSLDFLEGNGRNPGETLLQSYCKKEKRATYRPAKTYAQFLGSSRDIPLNQRYVWIRHLDAPSLKAWAEFAAAYKDAAGTGSACASFVLQSREALPGSIRHLKTINASDIREFDVRTFCSLISAGFQEDSAVCTYCADLAAALSGYSPEFAGWLLDQPEFASDPLGVWETGIQVFPDRALHPDEARSRLWLAQVQAVFPVVESYRRDFIEYNRKRLSQLLPQKNSNGQPVERVEEMELGLLYDLYCKKLIFLPDPEAERLCRFRGIRNQLAHLDTLDLAVLKVIFQYPENRLVRPEGN